MDAQAGSGKTTLIASYLDARKLPCIWYQVDAGDGDIASFFYYMGLAGKKAAPRYKKPLPLLTPEYLQGIPVFTRRYFEELFHRLKPPFIIVFDNYQDAPQESGFHEMISRALETVPEGITVIILSRIDPPPQLARLQANNRLQLIGGDDVRFTREESGELLKTQGRGKPDKKTVDSLHQKTEGWAAGLVLLMAGAGSAGPGTQSSAHISSASLFDYFASEIFTKADATTQDVLLKTSFFQRINAMDAELLTENGMAGQILEQLSRSHYFTQKYDRAYQYHPLFREFLQNRAQHVLSPEDIARIRGGAAGLLEKSGRLEEAIGLSIESHDWGQAERLLLSQAPALMSQGRSNTLEGWLRRLPEDRVAASPWLLYWSGICRMAFDPLGARAPITKAFSLFRESKDISGQYLSWAAVIESFVYAWSDFRPVDAWIEEYQSLSRRCPRFPSQEIEARVAAGMFSALFWRQPRHPELPKLAERLGHIVLRSDNVSIRMAIGNNLVLYLTWMGDFSKAALIVDTLRIAGRYVKDPLPLQWWWGMEATYSWFVADHAACLAAISQGTALGNETGVHLLDFFLFAQGIYSGLSQGELATAENFLNRIAALNTTRTIDRSLYHYMAGSVYWYRGDLPLAREHGERAVRFSEEAGCPFTEALCRLELAITLFDMNSREEAGRELARARDMMQGLGHTEFLCRLYGAWFAFQQGETSHGVKELRMALHICAEQGYLNFTRWRPETMSFLCAKALEQGIETEYVKNLIAKRGLVPEQPVENWPYPVRIRTLGRFSIEKNNKPLVSSVKVQKKPLEMLKALISLGGENVTEEKIAEELWPDADGDQAHRSFETTLYRLRQLISDKALRFQDKLLSLDKRCCRVDVWDFEYRIGPVETSQAPEAMRRMEAAFALYEGHFLPADSEAEWSVTMRERLRNKFTRLVVLLGGYWEGRGDWERALEYFQKGVEIDCLAEELYQRAMTCQLELGRHAQAASTYNRCKAALARALGVGPSPRTEEIRASIREE